MSGIIGGAGSKSGVIGETEVDHRSPSGTHGGAIVQTKVTSSGAVSTGTNYTVWDDTVPPIGEGHVFLSVAITPQHASNILRIEAQVTVAANHGLDYAFTHLYEGTTHLGSSYSSGVNSLSDQCVAQAQMVAGSTSELTFHAAAASKQSGTITINGIATARKLGGGIYSFIRVTEYTRPH